MNIYLHLFSLISNVTGYDINIVLTSQHSECNILELTCYRYVDVMGLEEPTDNIGSLLVKVAVKQGKTQRKRDISGKKRKGSFLCLQPYYSQLLEQEIAWWTVSF
jgi:hypothetical protein